MSFNIIAYRFFIDKQETISIISKVIDFDNYICMHKSFNISLPIFIDKHEAICVISKIIDNF